MLGNTNRVEFLLTAKDEAGKVIKQVSDQVGNLGETVKTKGAALGERAKSNEKNFQSMRNQGGIAFAALAAGSTMLYDIGAESASITSSYERMTDQMGIAGNALLDELNKASKGTIDNTSLMLTANRAMAMGVAKDQETMTELMEIARLKAQDMGISTTQAFNDIVTGIGRGSPLILDNLGIVVKQAESQERYAETLGKTVEEMTDAEKSQALLNAVLTDGRAQLQQVGDVALTESEKLAQLKKSFLDSKGALGEALIPAFNQLIQAVTPIITKITTFAQENPKLTATLIIGATAVAGLTAALGTLGLMIPGIITAVTTVGTVIGALSLPITALIAGLGLLVYMVVKNWDEIKRATQGLFIQLTEWFDGMREKILGWSKVVGETLTNLWTELKTFTIDTWNFISDSVGSILDWLQDKAINIRTGIKDFIFSTIDSIVSFFSGGGRSMIEAGFNSMLGGLSGIAKQILNGAIGVIEGFVNKAIQGINKMIMVANEVPGVNIRTVSPVSFGRLAQGGIAGFGTYGGESMGGAVVGPAGHDKVPAMLSAGELVLNKAQQTNLANQLERGGSSSGPTIVVQGNNFYGNDKDFMEKIAEGIMEEFKLHYSFTSI